MNIPHPHTADNTGKICQRCGADLTEGGTKDWTHGLFVRTAEACVSEEAK